MKTPKQPETPKTYHNPCYGEEATEKAVREGFQCEYIDGRPLFTVTSERQKQAVYKWCKLNYGRSFGIIEVQNGQGNGSRTDDEL